MDYPKYSLHLFAGAGGGLLADIIDGIRPVCAVEIEKYPQRVLAKRFPDLAIWDDVRTFRADNPECADAFADLRAVADELVIAGGFPCQVSAARGAVQDYAANVVAYGESMRVSFARYDPPSCSWKIHPCLFQGDLATFSETWPRFGMMRRGVSYRLRTWEPCTCASGSGSPQDAWPTPTVHGNDNFKGASAKSGDGLMTVIKRREGYPTPCARDHHAGGPGANRAKGHMLQLSTLVQKLLPTPQARDCHSGTARPHGWAKSGKGTQNNLNDYVLKWPIPCATDYKGPGKTPRDRLDYAVNGKTKSAIYPTPRTKDMCGGTGAKNKIDGNPNLTPEEKRHMKGGAQLNPDWDEWLMFWPVGWTDIETPNIRLVWLDPSIDPADYGEIPRITNRRDNRPARVKAIGNGQYPLSAVIAFDWGLCVLEAAQ